MTKTSFFGWGVICLPLLAGILLIVSHWFINFPEVEKETEGIWISYLIIQGVLWLGFLFLLGWVGYLLQQQWLKEQELLHIANQEKEAKKERKRIDEEAQEERKRTEEEATRKADVESKKPESLIIWLNTIKKLVDDDLIEKDDGKDLVTLIKDKLKNQLNAQP